MRSISCSFTLASQPSEAKCIHFCDDLQSYPANSGRPNFQNFPGVLAVKLAFALKLSLFFAWQEQRNKTLSIPIVFSIWCSAKTICSAWWNVFTYLSQQISSSNYDKKYKFHFSQLFTFFASRAQWDSL